ncbi:MAG: hypothetical protein KJZ85_09280 [Rhodobacteraceae bacterium]|jgi:hypothetical protein|nr:hypothetical protein [Paracoccaceae bacterium]
MIAEDAASARNLFRWPRISDTVIDEALKEFTMKKLTTLAAASALLAASATAGLAGGPVIVTPEPEPVVVVPGPAGTMAAGVIVAILAAGALLLVLSDSDDKTPGER